MAAMENRLVFDKDLTKLDSLALQNLAADLEDDGYDSEDEVRRARDRATLAAMQAMNDPADPAFEPTVLTSIDLDQLSARVPKFVNEWLLRPYVALGRAVVRNPTDVVMLTHILLYFGTSVPSAVWLFLPGRFTWVHGLAHFAMQASYVGTYTLMRHQHIHQRGVLAKRWGVTRLFDRLFPYVTDPLMGHTWNSYYYHHVKHHHVEGNGPGDLSSTVRYQRDNVWHFLHYEFRFFFLVWLDLPLYFLRKNKPGLALQTAFWEWSYWGCLFILLRLYTRPTICVFLLPVIVLRLGLMVGNFGQHALVDADDPDSDYRSSITLIDTQSNRHCYNDGYHTSHHLNPLRHWREHPVAFIKAKETYVAQGGLVFHNIDYIMITVRLLMKDYEHLARCMVPLGKQAEMTMEERVAMLKRCTRKFTEEEIQEKFYKKQKQ